VDCEYHRIKKRVSGRPRTELIPQILGKFEEAGDAMRYLDARGRVAWKATPRMRSRLADAEREARDDLVDVPLCLRRPRRYHRRTDEMKKDIYVQLGPRNEQF
jgi:hypothetical protein